MHMRTVFCILLFVMTISLPKQLFAQTSQYDTVRVEAYITPEGDTIPQSWLPTVMVSAVQTNALKNYWKNYAIQVKHHVFLVSLEIGLEVHYVITRTIGN